MVTSSLGKGADGGSKLLWSPTVTAGTTIPVLVRPRLRIQAVATLLVNDHIPEPNEYGHSAISDGPTARPRPTHGSAAGPYT
jgi:hypothetical protein